MTPQDPSTLYYALLSATGLGIGVFGSFTGLGGSIILTPILATAFGLSYDQAVACALAQLIGMSSSAFIKHHRLGHVEVKLAALFVLGSVPSAILGRLALGWLASSYDMEGVVKGALHVIYGVFLLLAIAWTVIKSAHKKKQGQRVARRAREGGAALLIFGGALAGFSSGFLALGGGLITVPLLIFGFGLPLTSAVGTSMFQMIFSAASATGISMMRGEIQWLIVCALLLGSIIGARIGPTLLHHTTLMLKRRRDARSERA